MNLSKFVQMRLQGACIDSPIANDMGGGGGGTNTIQQNSDPWGGVQPHLMRIFDQARTQSGESTLGAQSPYTLQSQELQAQRALSGSPLNQAAQQQNLATVRGDYTDLSKNPAAQNAMSMAQSKINSQFTGDNFGNSAHQEWLSKGLLGAAAPFYESERGRQQQAIGMAPGLASQDYADIGQLGSVGAGQDARAQQVADEPWQRLFNYQRAISGAGGGQSSTQNPYSTNPYATALGMGLGGLGLYNGMTAAGLIGSGAAGYGAAGAGAAGVGASDLLGTMMMFA